MCTCTSHPSRITHSDADDNTISVSSLSHGNAKPPAPSPVTPLEPLGQTFPEGHFLGFGKHRDGSNIGEYADDSLSVMCQIKLLKCMLQLLC